MLYGICPFFIKCVLKGMYIFSFALALDLFPEFAPLDLESDLLPLLLFLFFEPGGLPGFFLASAMSKPPYLLMRRRFRTE